MEEKNIGRFKKDIGLENFLCLGLFLAFFILIGRTMGGINMIKTMMNTGFDLLMNVCLYLMAIAVLAGAISGLFSEFGVIALVNKLLSKVMKPIYDLPGASSLGMLNCYLSDNPAILTLAHDDNFRRYFKKYQMPALTNLGTAFGMGLITTTTMMGLNVEGAVTSALIGNLGAVIGSVVSVRLMMHATKKMYGTTEYVEVKSTVKIPENSRVVREGSAGSRFIQAILDGGKVGVDMGLSIIPGVVIICTLVIILTNGPGAEGVYTGSANEGVGILPWIGGKLSFILNPLFGFSSPEAIAVPITALGSTGAAIGTVAKMAAVGKVSGNDIAVFTAICMCWSGYISTHIAMMDALGTKEATGKALISHTIGGLVAGFAAHILYMLFHMF
ncbi:CD0519/CD1768 family membrane protein [Parvimonas sp. G1425]|uniref:CD0519/CD1768 family membrane protein n=1 Tax=Parvimonas sp. G1425 TaxID=3387694 RepID=UPI0039E4AC8B